MLLKAPFTLSLCKCVPQPILLILQLRPNFCDAWSNLASAYMRKGRLGEAAQCCRQALALNPLLVISHPHSPFSGPFSLTGASSLISLVGFPWGIFHFPHVFFHFFFLNRSTEFFPVFFPLNLSLSLLLSSDVWVAIMKN